MKPSKVTLPVQTLFQMTEMQTHEDLMAAGKLYEFDEEMGNAMFVSHQWVTSEHPDPEMEQLGVLQQALQNLLAGRSQVSRAPAEELWMSRLRCPTMSDFNARALYLWYDYFSCPQGTSPEAALNQQLAIDCIPSYVTRLTPTKKMWLSLAQVGFLKISWPSLNGSAPAPGLCSLWFCALPFMALMVEVWTIPHGKRADGAVWSTWPDSWLGRMVASFASRHHIIKRWQ